MAEERTLGLARAPETDGDEERTKAELQRRMEEARESITQTVSEIRDTVVNKYESVKESVSETLDWREQYRKRPVAWSVGASAVGLIVGYSLAGAFMGDDEDYSDVWNESYAPVPKSYAGQAITGGPYGSTALAAAPAAATAHSSRVEASYEAAPQASATVAQSGSSTSSSAESEEEDNKPGLIERFKGTRAYDRLEEEVSHLGERLVDELSRTAQSVVLPLIFKKIKNYFGLDLSTQQRTSGGGGQQQTSGGTQQASSSQEGEGSTSYAKSPNLPYGAQSP